MGVGGLGMLFLLGCALAESPPSPPAPRGKALGKPKVGIADDDDTRPALLRRGAAKNLLSGDADDDATAVVDGEGDADETSQDAAEAVEEKQPLWQQFIPLVVVLLVRMGMTIMRAFYAKRAASGEGGAAGSPLDAVNAALLASPLGGVLKTVGGYWEKMVAFARSPQAAPFMMGLLIVATRLVKMMDGGNEADDVVEEAAEAEAAVEEAPEVETVEEADEAEDTEDTEDTEEGEGEEDGDEDDK